MNLFFVTHRKCFRWKHVCRVIIQPGHTFFGQSIFIVQVFTLLSQLVSRATVTQANKAENTTKQQQTNSKKV